MHLINNHNYSYWEIKQYFRQFDLVVIGSGIVGLSTAISFIEKHKNASVLVLERGILPSGASTKNAGFACFGSAGELLEDLRIIPENVVWETVHMRWQGLLMLRKRLGDKAIGFKQSGGFELFSKPEYYNETNEQLVGLNKKMKENLGLKKCYALAKKHSGFNGFGGIIHNQHEGEIDTGLMMSHLLMLAQKKGIKILNNVSVSKINDLGTRVELQSNAGLFKAARVVVATNGFSLELLKIKDVKPARAQVLITEPIKNLKIKGTYHFEQGYYYFRSINNRLLLGGGRNLDIAGETTMKTDLNQNIQKNLEKLLREMILPGIPFKIENRWTGIMGVGREKKPIIQAVSKNVLAAVRMGGMGIAIGSWVGKKAANEL